MSERKTAILTGASSGLGRALAGDLVKRGYEVVLVARSESGLQQTIENLGRQYHKFLHPLVCDLSDLSAVETVLESSEKLLHRTEIDLLINNAAGSVSGRVEDIPNEQYRRIFEVNYLAPVALVRQVLASMRKRNQGSIVNVSSGVAQRALPFESPYCAAKAALNSFSESLRVELKGTQIHLLLFSPGPVASGFHRARTHFGKTRLLSPPFHGRDPQQVSQILCDSLERQKKHVTVGFKANVMNHINHCAPRLADKIVGRMFQIEAV